MFQAQWEFNHEVREGDINQWIYKDVSTDNDTHLRQFKAKYHVSHKWATKKWNFQGGGLGQEE